MQTLGLLGRFIAGFLLSRIIEYPTRVLLSYVFLPLFELLGVFRTGNFRYALNNVPNSVWWHYRHDVHDIFLWGLWALVGAMTGLGTSLSKQVGESSRKAYSTTFCIFVITCVYGIYVWRYGWREYTPFLLTQVPMEISIQFYFGQLLSRKLPIIYRFLNETRVEDWVYFLRRRQ